MEVAIMASLFAKGDMNVNSGHGRKGRKYLHRL